MVVQNLEGSSFGEVLGWALPSTEEVLTLPIEELISRLKSSLDGLSSEDVKRRLEFFGYNELVRKRRRAAIIDFLSHFKSPLIIILLTAGLISGFFGEVANTAIIFVIVTLSVALDFYQESKAERAAEMLKQRVATTATVLREGALIVVAAKAGLGKEALEKTFPRIGEIPFTSERKRMTTVHKTPDGEVHAYMKGAPEILLERCTHIFEEGKERRLTEERKKEILAVNEQLATNALRVLAMAYKRLPMTMKYEAETVEKGMVFVGLQGMIDPPREEAIDANKKCQKAGIKTVMITGDHKLTAIAVAKEVGIYKEGDMVLTGAEMNQLSDEEFEEIVEKVTVYARVSPEHKLKIVNALKKKGHIVAMTGDGVNDAPAVKAADVGVAMGISGTDVTREASDLVLTDDNFATIVKAVEQGRVIYDNIRKYARFLISCNFDELLVIGAFAILGGIFSPELYPLPLLPAMILWINLVTDGAPAVALATDPPDLDVMDRPPRKPEEGILHGMGAFIIASFVLQATGTFLVFCLEYYVWPSHPWIRLDGTIDEVARQLTYREATTTAFVQAALFELFVVWNCRSEKRSVWRMGRKAFQNRFFVIADLTSVLLTLGITYIPITQQLFHLTGLSLTDLAYVTCVASWGLFIFPEIFMGRKVWKWE
ncbi:MAG: cation-translocating P-type ATPase [Candidatus Bathyarchaeia archaeon]